MYTIRKKVKFEMSHVLNTSYSKACQQIHGHSYILEIFLRSNKLNADEMVMDFGEIKKYLWKIINRFDHKMVVSEAHDLAPKFADLAFAGMDGIMFVPYNPTAEAMAKDIFMELSCNIQSLYKVRLHETDTGYAEFKL